MKDWERILAASVKRQWKRYREALRRCRRKFSEKAVHDSRVETRRLISLLDLLAIFIGKRRFKKARRALREHLGILDELRDIQVQLLLLQPRLRDYPQARIFRDALVQREEKSLRKATRRIRHVKLGRLRKLVPAVVTQLEDPRKNPHQRVRDRAAILAAVEDAFADLVDLRNQMDPGQVATIHRTRVAFKKYRYMMEAMQPLWPDVTPTRLGAMHAFQTLFGDLQDTDVFLMRLDKFAHGDRERAVAVAGLRHWLLRCRTDQIRRCLDRADLIFEFQPPANNNNRRKPVR